MTIILTILSFSLIHAAFALVWIGYIDSFFARKRHSDAYMEAVFILAIAEAVLCLVAVVFFFFKSSFFGVQLEYPRLSFVFSVVPGMLIFWYGNALYYWLWSLFRRMTKR